jgi:hypothetical protein
MKRDYVGLLAVLSLASLSTPSVAHPYHITVTGTDTESRHVPLKVSVPLAEADDLVGTITLRDQDGNAFPAQLTPPALLSSESAEDRAELHFVLPRVPAGEVIQLDAETGEDLSSGTAFRWHDTPGRFAELTFGDRPVLRYMYEAVDDSSQERREATYKVYHHVYDPQGKRFVTKGPGGLFPHHRGLFYGFNRISYGSQKADIWHCRQGESQVQQRVVDSQTGPVLGRHRLAIDWNGRDGKPFARELREMTAYRVPGGLLIEFASELDSTSAVGPVRLDGDPQHAGFQFRGSQEIPDRTRDQTYYLRPDGRGEPGSFRNWPQDKDHVNLPWNAMSFVLGDQRYTCCYVDHPQNPKPARYSERDYGRFGSYFAYDLDSGRPLHVRYRVWLQEGEMEGAEAHAHRRAFVNPPAVRLSTSEAATGF